jgi:hypothetical protein
MAFLAFMAFLEGVRDMTHMVLPQTGAARAVVEDLQARGFSLKAEENRLLVWPADRLTDADREQIRTYKCDILRPLPQNAINANNAITPLAEAEDDVAFEAYVCRAIEQDQGLPVGTLVLWVPEALPPSALALWKSVESLEKGDDPCPRPNPAQASATARSCTSDMPLFTPPPST